MSTISFDSLHPDVVVAGHRKSEQFFGSSG